MRRTVYRNRVGLVDRDKIMYFMGIKGFVQVTPDDKALVFLYDPKYKLRVPDFSDKWAHPQILPVSEAGFHGMIDYLEVSEDYAVQEESQFCKVVSDGNFMSVKTDSYRDAFGRKYPLS